MILLLALACTAPESGADTGHDAVPDTTHGVLVTTDYVAGSVARLGLDGTITPDLLPTGGDSIVLAEGNRLFLLDRMANVVRAYDDGALDVPAWETNVGDGANPTGLATCDGKVFVARLLLPSMAVLDAATGAVLGEVDLRAFADADGAPEADSVLAIGGAVWVTLNQLDYLRTYRSTDGSGTLVRVDCSTWAVSASWDVGPNPHAIRIGTGPRIALFGGDYFDADGAASLDGRLQVFDTATQTLGPPVLTEAEAGGNLGNVVLRDDGRGILTLDDGTRWSAACFDLGTATLGEAWDAGAFIPQAVLDPDGAAWLLQRPPYAGEAGELGAVRVDLDACTRAPAVRTRLPPYSLAFVVPA